VIVIAVVWVDVDIAGVIVVVGSMIDCCVGVGAGIACGCGVYNVDMRCCLYYSLLLHYVFVL